MTERIAAGMLWASIIVMGWVVYGVAFGNWLVW